MSYGIVRVQKMGGGGVKGIEIHDRREKDGISHTNQDIDWARSNQNYDLHPAQNESFTRAVKERIAELELPRAVRKDAVVLGQVLVTSDRSFFDQLMPAQTKEFFEDSYKFLADRYGKENTISATVHMDERTPHMHFNFVPVTEDGRLAAKSVLTRQSLIEQQDRFAEEVGKKYGLDRGERGGQKKHLETIDYKVATRSQEVDELSKQRETLVNEKNVIQGQIAALQGRLDHCTEFIARLDQIPKGKKTLLGKVEFTTQEAAALVKTAETVYSAQSTASRAMEDATKMKEYANRVRSSVSGQEVGKLKGTIQELKQEIGELKKELKSSDKAIERVNKVFDKHPQLADEFFKAEKEIEKALQKGMSLGLSR